MHEAGLLAAAIAEALAAAAPEPSAEALAASAPEPSAAPAVPTGAPAGVVTGTAGAGGDTAPAVAAVPVAVTVRVHDPMHVAPESALMYAELALRERALDGVPVSVVADPVVCAICDAPNEVRADYPFCAECGFPLPDRGGHAVEVEVAWTSGAVTTGGAR